MIGFESVEVSITKLSDRREQFLNHGFSQNRVTADIAGPSLAGNRKSPFSVPAVATAPYL